MITKSDIKLVCNYIENTKPSLPVGTIYYIENVTEDDELYKLQIKKKNRDLAIDAILDDSKVKEYLKNKSEIWPLEELHTYGISPRIKSINLTAISYIDNDDIWNSVLQKLETLTSTPMSCSFPPNITIKDDINYTSSKNNDINSRKVLTRINMLSNMIASESYMGPAKTIICGTDCVKYIVDNPMFITSNSGESIGYLNGLNVVISDKIKSNKIIVIRSSTGPETGLNVFINNNLTYFISETPGTWQRCIKWFEVI